MTQQQDRVENFTKELRQDRPVSDRSIGEIFNALRPRLQELVNKQIELAKAELTPVGRQAGVAIGLLVVGAIFLLLFLGFFFATFAAALIAFDFPVWVSIGIVTVILLLIGGALAGLGAGRLRTLDPKPRRTIAALQQNIDWVKGQLRP